MRRALMILTTLVLWGALVAGACLLSRCLFAAAQQGQPDARETALHTTGRTVGREAGAAFQRWGVGSWRLPLVRNTTLIEKASGSIKALQSLMFGYLKIQQALVSMGYVGEGYFSG